MGIIEGSEPECREDETVCRRCHLTFYTGRKTCPECD